MDPSVPSLKKKEKKNHFVFEMYVYQMGGLHRDFNQVVYCKGINSLLLV